MGYQVSIMMPPTQFMPMHMGMPPRPNVMPEMQMHQPQAPPQAAKQPTRQQNGAGFDTSRVKCSNCDAFGHSFRTCDQPFDKQRVTDKELAIAVRRQQGEERIGLINANFVNREMAHLQRQMFGQGNLGQGVQFLNVQQLMTQILDFTHQLPPSTPDIPPTTTSPTTPPKVWRLRWGTFVCSRVEEKDFAERFKGLRGFISWFPWDPWDVCVFVQFANDDDGKTAKLLLGGMCFSDASGAVAGERGHFGGNGSLFRHSGVEAF